MNKGQKKDLIRIIISAAFYAAGMIISHIVSFPGDNYVMIALFLISYVIVGYKPISKAARNIMNGQIFDENFLMTIATAGALALQQWDEAVAVMLFYSVGELFEDYAVDHSRRSISDLMDLAPDRANRITEDGEESVDPYDIVPGDIIIVRPGEKVPLDGIITEGSATVDTSALTGESAPRYLSEGMQITSGFISISGMLKIEVTSAFEESTVAKILDLVENSGSKKAKVEKFITRFARYYTPAVVFSAIALAIIPPLFFSQEWNVWIYRALLFLVISCPCALVISVPLAFFGGVGAASRAGVLVKGSNYLETMADIDTVIFDKTGTLTNGTFTVSEVLPSENSDDDPVISKDELLRLAAHAEANSNHPIALSIRDAYKGDVNKQDISSVTEIPGKGVSVLFEDKQIYAGNSRLMEDLGITVPDSVIAGTYIYMAQSYEKEDVSCQYLGSIILTDTIKEDAFTAITRLRQMGVKKTVMLTGDLDDVSRQVAEKLSIDECYSQLMPQDKVDLAEQIIENDTGKVAYTGDGINDAPVLARADIGIAMGGAGSQAAIEAADIVIMDDSPSKIASVMEIAGKTGRIARQNVIFALAVKALILILGAIGIANMWLAVFADVGVAVLAILNSMRMLVRKK